MTTTGPGSAGAKHDVPSIIGRYRIERHLAEGGMGDVYLATDPAMERKVAIKLLKRMLNDDPQVVRRFSREAVAVAALEHEAIVPVYDFGQHEGQQYFVMRYVAGGTLRDRIDGGPIPVRDVSRIIDRIAAGLEAAHARGIVHRDIKPANILFDRGDQVYLSDFGIAKNPQSAQAQDETGTLLLGTPQYLSPEQARGEELDGRSDVYSLGVVAYHAITGTPPFEGNSAMAVAMAHVMDPPPSIRERVGGLPEITDAVFQRVLAKEPDRRYPSPTEFARDLRDIATGRWYLVKLTSAGQEQPTQTLPPRRKPNTKDTGEFMAAGRPFADPTVNIRRPGRRKTGKE